MTDSRILLVDGVKNIKHLVKTVSTADVDVLAEAFPTGVPTTIFHVRVIISNDAAARFNINSCATTTATGMYASQTFPIDVLMHISTIVAVRSGDTDANCEITIWW
jgi:hypothetical protein